jgi:hypothetical protein
MAKKEKKGLHYMYEHLVDHILSHIPHDIVEHLGKSKKEILLALRSVIDKAIERIDSQIERSRELQKEK